MEERNSSEIYDADLTPLSLPRRHPRMPTLYKVKDHPLHPKSNPGTSYLFYTKPTEASMQEFLQAGQAIAVEPEVEVDPDSAGYLKVKNGDYIWTRNEVGSRKASDDVAVTWKTGKAGRCPKKMKALDDARDMFMGPKEDITEDSVHFERLDPRPKPVKKAPCANGKVKGGVKEYNIISHDLVVASTNLAMEDMEQAPEGVRDVLKSEFDRHGMAPLGWRGNYAYHAVQCNLAYAGHSMEDQMGRYGEVHRDEKDCPTHYSTIITRSKLPPNYRPPRIFFTGLGIYADLDDFEGLSFQGLRDHVGSPPYPLPGTAADPKAYRVAFIHYTPRRMATADTRQRIVSTLPILYSGMKLTYASRRRRAQKDLIRGLREDSFANFIRDAIWIMEDEGFIPSVGRVGYLVLRFLLMQANERFDFDLDPVLLAKSISYVDSDGTRRSIEPWQMAPPLREGQHPERDAARQDSEDRFNELVFKHGSMIPFTFMTNKWIRDEVVRRYGIGGGVFGCPADKDSGSGGVGVEDAIDGIVNDDNDEGVDSRQTSAFAKRKRIESESDQEDCTPVVSDSNRERSIEEMKRVDGLKRMKLSRTVAYGDVDQETREGEGYVYVAKGLQQRQSSRKVLSGKAEDSYKFLGALSVDTLEEELLELRQELLAVEASKKQAKIPFKDIKKSLDQASSAIEIGGIGRKALKGVEDIIEDVQRLSVHIKSESNRLRGARRTLIKAQVSLRWWIEGPVAEEARKAAQTPRMPTGVQNWVGRLTNNMVEMLVFKRASKTFRAMDYGLDWGRIDAVVDNAHVGRMMLRGQEDTVREAVAMVVSVVETWAEADRVCDKKQAWFVAAVEDVMGEEALSMNVVWKLFQNFRTSHVILGDKGYRNPTAKDMEPFRAALEGHSVNNPEHREGQIYDMYKQLFNCEITPSKIVKSLPSLTPKWSAMQEMVELAAVYDNDETPLYTSAYFKKLQGNPQLYHPIRERAPGRIKCKHDILDGSGAITMGRIFSLLVWRAFPNVFSWHPDHSMLYLSPEEYLLAYRAITKSQVPSTVVDVVKRYWETLEEGRWQNFADTNPTFDQCYQRFKPSGHLERRLFPKLSKTAAFEVTCDLAYAGFCQPPMVTDVSRYIVMLNQGAWAGLKILGLVDGKKKDVETRKAEVAQALLDLGEVMKEMDDYDLDDGSQRDFMLYEEGELDPMAIEHFIRTFSQASKLL
ncbi:hypothetical protein MD484_g4825, partial [Candolleomyces efflorescens]